MTNELIGKTKAVSILSEKNSGPFAIAIRDDGIARIAITENIDIEVNHIKEIVSLLEQAGDGQKFPVLIVASEFTLPSAEARAYLATPESDPYAIAEAYITSSFSQRLVGKVYLSLNRPARPTRLFKEEAKAIEWLRTFL
ncbi:MAG: hypothetical protein K0S44_1944 [Bacteroidetes bacterium]|jgi:hypothetical protein|nr:hypothetical protein [Bacteroidota bacterium]